MSFSRVLLIIMCVLVTAALAFASAGSKSTATTEPTPATPQAVKADSAKAKGPAIQWVAFDEGLRRASSERKSMLLDFTASWCGWCKRMEKETFSDTAVIRLINENFVAVKVWGDSDKLLDINGYKIAESDLAVSSFGITGYPTFFFLCPDGLGYRRLVGYQQADAFKAALAGNIGFNCDSLKTAFDQAQKLKQEQQQQEQPKSEG